MDNFIITCTSCGSQSVSICWGYISDNYQPAIVTCDECEVTEIY